MIDYRDPLLDKIRERISGLREPAFVKNSELVYIAANEAFARLFGLVPETLVGTRGSVEVMRALAEVEDKERACLVFGEEQIGSFDHPSGLGRFRVEMERFALADGQTFLYGVLYPLPASHPAQEAAPVIAHPRVANAWHQTGEAGCGSELAELIMDNVAGGICVYDRDGRLVYFNRQLQELYEPVIGPVEPGMTLGEILGRIADALIREGADPDLTPATRQRWIEERIRYHRLPHSRDIMPLPNGRWLQCSNRRLPDGMFVGLRIDITDLKHNEALMARHVQEIELYRELLERLPVAAFVRGPDQKLVYANQAYAELFGRSREDLLGTDEFSLLGDHAQAVWEANNDTLTNGTEYQREEKMPVAGGRIADTVVSTGRVIGTNGMPYVVGTVIDLSQFEACSVATGRQRSLDDRDLDNIISSLDVALLVLDRDLNVQLVNNAFLSMVRAEGGAESFIGRPFRDLLREHHAANLKGDGDESFDAYCERRIAEIRSGRIEPREAVLENGTVLIYSGIRLSDGRFLLSYVDTSDISRRDAELVRLHALADDAYRLVRNATDTMPEGLMVIRGELIVFANASLARVLNVPEELLATGGRWDDVFRATAFQNPELTEEEVEASVERFRTAIAARKDVTYTFPLDGERWVRLEMRSREDCQCVVLCTDQTATMRREAELTRLISKAESADRAKSEFLASMSHEIRTPMNGILGMAELLAKSPLDTRQRAFVEIITKSGNALLTVINDIIDFAKLESGHMQLKYAPFDPAEAIEDIATLHAAEAAEKNIELIVSRVGHIPHQIMGDAARFRQIIGNLLSNAVKYTERGHITVEINTVADGRGQTILNVTVEDTGIGIPSDQLAVLFERASHLEVSRGWREGKGLGLAICQRLAALQGGTISVDSTEGKGSAFTLTLPVRVAEASGRPKALPANVVGAHVLVIEDNTRVRNHIVDEIESWGFDCVGSVDGQTALSIIEAAIESAVSIDAVVLDSELPGEDCANLVERIRAIDPSNAAIILMTSASIAAGEHYQGLDVEAHLTKPLRMPLLRETLIDAIRAKKVMAPPSADVVDLAGFSRTHRNAQEAGPSSEETPRGPLVLVAEDNEVNRLFFTQILSSAGIEYRVACDGEEAIALWREHAPTVVLMDTHMPRADGFEATSRIRAMEMMTGERTPIIGVLSHDSAMDRERGTQAGMDDFIMKPVTPERLEDMVRKWSGEPRPSTGALQPPA